jgi:hypothetical protein
MNNQDSSLLSNMTIKERIAFINQKNLQVHSGTSLIPPNKQDSKSETRSQRTEHKDSMSSINSESRNMEQEWK